MNGESNDSIILKLLSDIKSQGEKAIASGKRLSLLHFLFFAGPIILSLSYYFFVVNTNWMLFGPHRDVVGIVRIHGEIASGTLASADKVIPALKTAFENKYIRKVVLSIDSPGGAPVEAERIYTMMDRLRKEHKKPIVAVIQNIGASAAYMIAMHADEIVAANYSLVGSIGAIISALQFDGAAQRLGISQRVYASGHLKNFLNPFSLPSPDVDKKALDLVTEIGGVFVADLHRIRGDRLKPGVEYGTGEPWSAPEALKIGLVDRIGTLDEEMHVAGQPLDSFDAGPYPPNSFGLASILHDEIQSALHQVITESSATLR